MALTIMLFATQGGALVARFGAGRVLGVGLSLMASGLALFALTITVNGDYISNFLLPGLLSSVGVGLSVVPSTIAATATAAPSEAGLASGLVNTSRQMGGALGLAVLASLAVLYTSHLVSSDYRAPALAFDDGFRLAFLLGAGFALTGALVAFRFIPATMRPPSPAPAPPAPPAAATTAPSAPVAAGAAVAAVPLPARAPLAEAPPPQSAPAVNCTAGARARRPFRQPPAPAPSRRRVSAVSLSLAGGGSWALAGGSMTVAVSGGASAGDAL